MNSVPYTGGQNFTLGGESTLWDGENQKAGSTPEHHESHLTQSPPQTLVQDKAAQDSGKFRSAKDELREVDVQPKAADVQAQPIVQQTGGEPASRGERLGRPSGQVKTGKGTTESRSHQTDPKMRVRFLRYEIRKTSRMFSFFGMSPASV